MTFASTNEVMETEGGGSAIWDIFPADASDTIRKYLNVCTNNEIDDPILRQTCYISPPQLLELREKYNIIPWRILQNPGEAIFIPAGCAHQVTPLLKPLGSFVLCFHPLLDGVLNWDVDF